MNMIGQGDIEGTIAEVLGSEPVVALGTKTASYIPEIEAKLDDIQSTRNNTVLAIINDIETVMKDNSSENYSNSIKIKIVIEKLTELMTYLLENSWQDYHRGSCLDIFVQHDILNGVYN